MHVPLAGSKATDGMLYESFEEAWNDTTRYCSVKEDLIWGYTAVVRGAHKIAGKYGRDWPSLLQEAAEAGCITAGLLASGPPEKGPGRSWMAEVSTNPSGDYTLTASFLQQSPHFGPVEITDMGMVTQGTIVTVEVGTFNFTNNKTPIRLTSSQWIVNLGSNLHGGGWEKGATGIIFTQRSGFGGNAAALIMVEDRSPGHYRRIGWAAVDTPRVELAKVNVCIG
ncbi:hypothetical protein CkaCkLH20_05240 [Colletotrichum karsti]|uniref:Uncharacterized protein n=1 Tax=Colletotrichum karsti TaxID=1095194 RepID=A0A9P6IF61_9PEZI|nr:uncharacterized protein CkaCkLH20_05240 [Colletotrichum karsti]KAF9877540.1 hypothetical protein CkaCkLH20_05240 [Colletotrichum karsti]